MYEVDRRNVPGTTSRAVNRCTGKNYVWLSNRNSHKNEGRLTQNCTLVPGREDGAISPDRGVRLHASLIDIDCRSWTPYNRWKEGERRVYELLMQLIQPLALTKKLHAEVWPLHELNSQLPAREAAPRQKSESLVE